MRILVETSDIECLDKGDGQYTKLDEFVQPNLDGTGTSSLHTGDGRITNVALQDICPASVAEHLAIGTYDPVAYARGMNALAHDGPADPDPISPSVCAELLMPGVNLLTFPTTYASAIARVTQELATVERVDAEPELRCYVFAECDVRPGRGASRQRGAN